MKMIKKILFLGLILIVALPSNLASADDTKSLSESVSSYTQYLLNLDELNETLQEETSCTYYSVPTMKTTSMGILLRTIYVCPDSNQHYETIILLTPRNFRNGEGTRIINAEYKLSKKDLNIGDWASIITWEFCNPAVLVTQNNAWVLVRGWKDEEQIDADYPTESLEAIAQSISTKLPDEFISLELPDSTLIKEYSQRDPSSRPELSVDWSNLIWFRPGNDSGQTEITRESFDQAELEFDMFVRWITFNDLAIRRNGREGSVVFQTPSDLPGEILIIHSGDLPNMGQFIQAWVFDPKVNQSETDTALLPDVDGSIIKYLNLEQQSFYSVHSLTPQEFDNHKFLIIYDNELVAKYSYHVNPQTFWDS